MTSPSTRGSTMTAGALVLALLFTAARAHADETPATAAPEASPVPALDKKDLDTHVVGAGDLRFKAGKGLEIKSDDGLFALATSLRAQFLYTVESEPEEDTAQGLQIRRARVTFSGHLFGKDNQFKAMLAVGPSDLGMRGETPVLAAPPSGPARSPLHDWYLHFAQLRDLNLRVGQWVVPFSRQRSISSADLQLVDRSIVNREFNLDRDLGVDLSSKDLFGSKWLRYHAGVFMGEGHSASQLSDFGLLYRVRLEALPFGSFPDNSEADLERRGTPGLSLGAAYAFFDRAKGNQGIIGKRPADGGTTDLHLATADLVFKLRGLSLLSEFIYREGERNPGSTLDDTGTLVIEPPRNGWGALAQTGYVLPGLDLEVAGRYALVRGHGDSSLGDTTELGGGVSYYVAGHALKLQLDYQRTWSVRIGDAAQLARIQLQGTL